MKTLLLLRHAKSSRDDPSLADFERPLNGKGEQDALRIGKFIKQEGISIDLAASSPATRARQTIEAALQSSGLRLKPRFDERIYEASGRRLLTVVADIEDAANTVLLVGHNPGFEELLEILTRDDRRMRTASLARIDLQLSKWKQVQPATGKLMWITSAKELKDDAT